MHNIEKNYFRNKIRGKYPLLYLPYRAICKSEYETLKNADRIITLTDRDSKTVKSMYGKSADQVLPMAFNDIFDTSKVSDNKAFDGNILFIGSMFGPNYEGIKWFAENVMPKLPQYSLKIVGKNFEKKTEELTSENVSVIGSVDDLSKYYYENNIMVMPIPYGDGIKIKTAEALMYGKTILASDEALEGYDVEGIDGIFRCNSVDDYIKVICQIAESSAPTFRKSVRQLFLDKYCLDSQIEECKKTWI